jgi:methyl-accepting chemotaxis protein
LLLARGITRPLNSLIAVSGRLASGDLSVSVSRSDSSDEVSLLQNSFSSMSESLRKMLDNMGSSVNELSTSAAQISATARQSAATAAEQASTAAEVSTSVEEIRQTSKAATETAREVVRVAEEATEKGQRGQDAIVEAVSVMQLIGERVGGVAGRILELNEKNAQIGEIVDTVNDLAEQSNLLAVNASIEAAKAGEQGRGFAVVASEVRNLAGQSKRATKQIAALLDEIRTASESTVMATEEASKRTEDGQGAIHSVKKLVAELATVLEASSERARQIAGATGQQAAGIDQIAEAMEGVAAGGHEAADGARQLEQSSASLSALAEQLRALTSAYKV